MQRDWPESCLGTRNCDELASNFSCKFPVQVSGACVAIVSSVHDNKVQKDVLCILAVSDTATLTELSQKIRLNSSSRNSDCCNLLLLVLQNLIGVFLFTGLCYIWSILIFKTLI